MLFLLVVLAVWRERLSVADFPVPRENTRKFRENERFGAVCVTKKHASSRRYRLNSLHQGTGNFFDPIREFG